MRRTAAAAFVLALMIAGEGLCRGPLAFGKASFRAEYRRILELYALGDQTKALTDLVAAESALTAEPSEVPIAWLLRVKRGVIRDLVRSSPDVLIPVVLLHQEAYLAYRTRHLSYLAVHSRVMAAELAEEYARRVQDEEKRRVASDLLTSLGGHVLEAAIETTGAGLYDRALRIDPENEAALAGRASVFERHGDFAGAVPLLERLVEVEPDNREARLRLGINLARLGRRQEGAGMLRQLLDDETPDWLLAVAYQELARLLAREGELELATSLLIRGVERLPCDATLPIQLAYYADRSGRRDGDLDLAQTLRRCAGRWVSSARFIYAEQPKMAVEARRGKLLLLQEANLQLLAKALSSSSSGEVGS